jgi:hypothetical protein
MRFLLLLTTIAATLFPGLTRADILITAPDVTASPGSSGSFDILLTNTGTNGVGIGAFSFDISTATQAVDFTGASVFTTAAPYVYAGNSFDEMNGFPLATKTGQELTASDTPNNAVQTILNGGMTLSLGKVFYTISPSPAFTSVDIVFSSTGTSLADYLGNPVPATTVNGDITLAPVPEPSQSILLFVSLGILALFVIFKARVGAGRSSTAIGDSIRF